MYRAIESLVKNGEKKIKKQIGENMIKVLNEKTPIITWDLKKGFHYYIRKNKVIIKDKMKYWFYVEFWPHWKKSLGFSRRSIRKVLRSIPEMVKIAFKKN